MLFSVVITSRGCHKSALQSHCLVTHTLTECQTPRPPPYRPGSQWSEERYKVIFIAYTRELIFQRYGLGCPTHKVGTHGFHECLGARKALRCFLPPTTTVGIPSTRRSVHDRWIPKPAVLRVWARTPGAPCVSLLDLQDQTDFIYIYYLYLYIFMG